MDIIITTKCKLHRNTKPEYDEFLEVLYCPKCWAWLEDCSGKTVEKEADDE